MNPHNRYQIAQLIGFAVNEIVRPKTNWLEQVADVKNVGYGEKAQFKTRLEGVRAISVRRAALLHAARLRTRP